MYIMISFILLYVPIEKYMVDTKIMIKCNNINISLYLSMILNAVQYIILGSKKTNFKVQRELVQ